MIRKPATSQPAGRERRREVRRSSAWRLRPGKNSANAMYEMRSR